MGFTVRIFTGLLLLSALSFAPIVTAAGFEASDLPNGPLRVRNLSPVAQLYGLPRMIGADILSRGFEASFNIEAANNFQSERRGSTFAFFDGESYAASYRLRGVLSEGFEWGVEVPFLAHTGGGLDGVVDEFHELFGLPDGERSLASRGRLDYLLRSDGIVYADFNDSRRALGDVRGFAGMQVFADPNHSLALRGQIKFPTGNVRDLSGSKGTDVSLWAEYERRFMVSDREIRLTLGGGGSYLGEGELIEHAQESWVTIGHLGIQIPVHPRVEVHGQIDAHTDILSTGNPLVADGGLLGTIGARIGVTKKFWLDLSLIEDLDNESASDVVFQLLLGTSL